MRMRRASSFLAVSRSIHYCSGNSSAGGVIVRVPSLAFGELPGWFLSLSVKNGLSSSFTRARARVQRQCGVGVVRAPLGPRDGRILVMKLYACYTILFSFSFATPPPHPPTPPPTPDSDSVIFPPIHTLQFLYTQYNITRLSRNN